MAGVKDMVTAARAVIENLAPADVAAELERVEALLVDVREPAETARGVMPGAVLVPRGMLEFRADHGTSSHVEGFEPGRLPLGSRSALRRRSATATWPISPVG